MRMSHGTHKTQDTVQHISPLLLLAERKDFSDTVRQNGHATTCNFVVTS